MEEIDADFGKRQRRMYFGCCIIGSILTTYFRQIFYAQYTYSFDGCSVKKFDKPWFATLVMAFGMSLANAAYKILLAFTKIKMSTYRNIPLSVYISATLPALFDIINSVLSSICILLIGSTFSTIIKFLDLVFATFIRRFWLKETILPYSWISTIIIVVGIILVSVSATINELSSMKFNGTFFIAASVQIIAQSLFAAQVIREEQILHKNDVHPMWLSGVEGVTEFLMILFMLYPILNFMPEKFGEGLTEDLCSACMMVYHSKKLIILFSVYVFIACFYNISVMGVEYMTSGIHFLVTENVVRCLSWFIDLLIKYAMNGSIFGLTDNTYGTSWNSWSYMRFAGVIIILSGSFIYIKVAKLPCFKYEDPNIKIINLDPIIEKENVIDV